MFSSVLQPRLQHPFSPSYHSHSNHRLENHGADSPFPRATDYEDANISPDPASSRLFQRPCQYAYPLRSPPAIPDQIRLPKSPAARVETSEYMLRRKTPNGTLAAGYDGAPVEWTRRPHAVKHILMPTSGISQTYSGHDRLRGGYDGATSSDVKVDEQHRWSSSKSTVSPPGIWGALPREDMEGQMNSYAQRKTEAGGMDSILSQIHLSQPYYKPTVPTVVSTGLQPLWPPPGDPMASNPLGSYVPYWPYEPYAPYHRSTLRYPGLSGRYNAQIQAPPGLQDQIIHNHALKGDIPSVNPAGTGAVSTHNSGRDTNIRYGCFPTQDTFTGQKHQKTPTDHIRSIPDHTNSVPLPYRVKSSQVSEDISQSEAVRSPSKSSHISNLTESESSLPIDTLQYREKVLIWAQRIHTNLLTSLHQARKHAHGKHSICRQPQVCIYPKPPGQHYLTLENVNENSYINTKVEEEALRFGTDQSSSCLKSMKSPLYSPNDEPALNDQSFYPSIGGDITKHRRYRQDKLPSRPRQAIPFQPYYNHQYSTEQNRNSATLAPLSPAYQTNPSGRSTVDARAAVDLITTICQESGWQWIDGLLLGGCLAYGLTEYEKALQWYSRVLICDSK